MKIVHTPTEAREFIHSLRAAGKTVGMVPTMGALHEGHLSLVQTSHSQCDETVASIFVNPTQFAAGEDLDKYPRTLQQDFELLESKGVAAVFVPDKQSMYPEGFSTYVDPPEVSRSLEGVCRPGHFRGVATVVMKLFQAMPTTHAFFGKKDYQQLKVIQAMANDLDVGIEIVACETMREHDGLAMSSRNRYLDDQQRKRALLLSAALTTVEQELAGGMSNADQLASEMQQVLLGDKIEGVDKIDYAVVVDAKTLTPLSNVDRPAVALIAAFVGKTRLIDNRELGVPE
ncbi:MAG: pantoate--beta-alanine ligase [Rubripirellula sp.]